MQDIEDMHLVPGASAASADTPASARGGEEEVDGRSQREREPRLVLRGRRATAVAASDAVAGAAMEPVGNGDPNSAAALVAPPVPGTQSVYLKTFGCAHNISDSEYMAGLLQSYGYRIVDDEASADVWVVNSCTVKNPSQTAMANVISRGRDLQKPLVVAGCVPQADHKAKELAGLSLVGVTQIDRVVEVVEETLRGNTVRLLSKAKLPQLDLPKIRRNKHVEILPINTGCLGSCTYCKTKHARGDLGSYTIESLVQRVREVVSDGVTEIWLSSEDTGAYGRDLGTDIVSLLHALIEVLPEDGSCMLRIGMTNPPYILEHLEALAGVLNHRSVYSFLHIPVQSGSDTVLCAMKREYTVSEFRHVCDTLKRLVPNITIATDIICGFPGETEEDFGETLALVSRYQFAQLHISQFYPRPGTPAARMKRVPTAIVKSRTRRLTQLFESFDPYKDMVGKRERIWIMDVAADGQSLVGHTKNYTQVLVDTKLREATEHTVREHPFMGKSADVIITSHLRWSVRGQVEGDILEGNAVPSTPPTKPQTRVSAHNAIKRRRRLGRREAGSNPAEPCVCQGCISGSHVCEEERKRMETLMASATSSWIASEERWLWGVIVVAFLGLILGLLGSSTW
mmetsp:Transcript_5265/g.19286  ORF Transcript_5265/g.19286 Transcript_5265/m.19286 type:complete len:627 (-) Transcript_5265:1307-3187(-)